MSQVRVKSKYNFLNSVILQSLKPLNTYLRKFSPLYFTVGLVEEVAELFQGNHKYTG